MDEIISYLRRVPAWYLATIDVNDPTPRAPVLVCYGRRREALVLHLARQGCLV